MLLGSSFHVHSVLRHFPHATHISPYLTTWARYESVPQTHIPRGGLDGTRMIDTFIPETFYWAASDLQSLHYPSFLLSRVDPSFRNDNNYYH